MKTIILKEDVLTLTSRSVTSWLTAFLVTFFFLAATPPLLHAQASKADIKAAEKTVGVAKKQLSGIDGSIGKVEKTIKKLDKNIASEFAKRDKIVQKRAMADKGTSNGLKKESDRIESGIATLQGKRNAAVVQLADLKKQREAAVAQLDQPMPAWPISKEPKKQLP